MSIYTHKPHHLINRSTSIKAHSSLFKIFKPYIYPNCPEKQIGERGSVLCYKSYPMKHKVVPHVSFDTKHYEAN